MSVSTGGDVTVLHVDDLGDFVEVTATYLEDVEPGFTVRTATSVQAACERISAEIDCIVSDYDMPNQSGLEFLEEVRADYPDLPFILFTGKGSEEIASRAISAGVDEYIQKETGTEQYTVLANRIRNLVRASRAEDAAERTEERYHNLIDTAPVPIVLFDETTALLYANDAAVDFLGADRSADLDGIRMPELVHPDDLADARERFSQVMEGTPAAERQLRIQTVDGKTKKGFVATAPGVYQGERVAQAVLKEPTQE